MREGLLVIVVVSVGWGQEGLVHLVTEGGREGGGRKGGRTEVSE